MRATDRLLKDFEGFLGFVALLFSALGMIALALLLAHIIPPSHEPCVKPTAMPVTWFGDCPELRR